MQRSTKRCEVADTRNLLDTHVDRQAPVTIAGMHREFGGMLPTDRRFDAKVRVLMPDGRDRLGSRRPARPVGVPCIRDPAGPEASATNR